MKKLRIFKVFSLLLCMIIVGQSFTLPVSAKTAGELRNEIEYYRKELSKLDKDKSEQSQYQITLSKQIDALSQQMQVFDDQMNELNIQIGEKQDVIDGLNEQIFDNESQIDEMKDNINVLELEKKSTEDQLRERMKENYVCEQYGPLNVLLSSEDFGDFISNVVYLKKKAEFDKKLTDKLDMQVAEINEEKSKIEDVVEKINKDKDVVVTSLNEVQEKASEINKARESKKSVSDELSSQLKKSTRQSDSIEQAKKRVQNAQHRAQCELEDATDAIRSVQKKNKGRFKGPVDVGGYMFPVEGSNSFIRGFNSSRGDDRHDGVDIGTYSRNNPVVASRGGRVIVSTFGEYGKGYGGYGNVVVIDHGDGYSTLYAHMQENSVEVKVGDFVSRGQFIGKVGNTGDVINGCIHLHFEVRKNGYPIRTPFG